MRENTPEIITNRLILRKFEQHDLRALYDILSDQTVNTYLPWFPHTNLKETEKFLNENYLKTYDEPIGYRYAICLKDDVPIGYLSLSLDESYDFGFGLKSEFWNQGIMTEAAKAVIEKIKDSNIPYITATHDKYNLSSGEVMKKLGMKYQYSYIEKWQPKNITVTFRMYQLNFKNEANVYQGYKDLYHNAFVEDIKKRSGVSS